MRERRLGLNGYPWRGGQVNGSLYLEKFIGSSVVSGFDADKWYNRKLRKKTRQLLETSIRTEGSIIFDFGLPLNRDNKFKEYEDHWCRVRTPATIDFTNFSGENNSYRSSWRYDQVIGIMTRHFSCPAFFERETERHIHASIMIHDNSLNLLFRQFEMTWGRVAVFEENTRDKWPPIAKKPLCMKFKGFAGYDVKDFSVGNESLRVNGVMITSIQLFDSWLLPNHNI